MPLFQAESITVTVFCMACRSINSISYSVCRTCVLDLDLAHIKICNESKYCHITPLLVDLHWRPVKFRIEFKILLIIFKIFKGLAPSYLSFLITPKPVCKYNLRSSSDSTLLSYPTLGERAFLFAAPKLWNAVPRFIRESISVDTFKGKLKTHLFKKAFCTI